MRIFFGAKNLKQQIISLFFYLIQKKTVCLEKDFCRPSPKWRETVPNFLENSTPLPHFTQKSRTGQLGVEKNMPLCHAAVSSSLTQKLNIFFVSIIKIMINQHDIMVRIRRDSPSHPKHPDHQHWLQEQSESDDYVSEEDSHQSRKQHSSEGGKFYWGGLRSVE